MDNGGWGNDGKRTKILKCLLRVLATAIARWRLRAGAPLDIALTLELPLRRHIAGAEVGVLLPRIRRLWEGIHVGLLALPIAGRRPGRWLDLVPHLVRLLRPPCRRRPAGLWGHGLLLLLLLLLRGGSLSCGRWVLPSGKILCLSWVAYRGRRRLRRRDRRNIRSRTLIRVGHGRFMRQLRDRLGVLLLRVGKVAGKKLLVTSLVLPLLVLGWELVLLLLLLLLMRPSLKHLLAVLRMLQVGRDLAVRLDVASVLAVSSILTRVGRRL